MTDLNDHVTSIRLPTEQHSDLETIAMIDNTSVSAVVREAIERELKRRRRDPKFQDRLSSHLKKTKRALERLAEK